MRILIESIPHADQRYGTCGDWYPVGADSDALRINISHLNDHAMESLVAVHELVEALLCLKRGITAEQVDAFDLDFVGPGEPGDDPAAPYHREHVFATQIEEMLAKELGVDWDAYGRAVDKLP